MRYGDQEAMNYARLCIGCMREKPDDRTVCPYCGFDSAGYEAENSALRPLSVLGGKYIIGKVLGSGGFGITYIALDVVLERRVAIKEFFMRNGSMSRDTATSNLVTSSVIDASVSKSREASQAKFENEARMLAHLERLDGIVSVYDYFHENNTSYIVMEYLDGQTLKNYVIEHGHGLSFDEVMDKLTPVMKSLQKLHDKGILHRDISPDNIMIRSDGSVVLFDFGGVKVYDESSDKSIVVLQKKGYTPYEQLVNEKQGPYTDVYAMAATIYYCLCGKAPAESLKRVGRADPLETPVNAGARMSPRQEKVLLKALAVMPEDRYQTIRDFYEALTDTKRHVPEKNIALTDLPKKKSAVTADDGHDQGTVLKGSQGLQTSQTSKTSKTVPVIGALLLVAVAAAAFSFGRHQQRNDQQAPTVEIVRESEQLSEEEDRKVSEAESQAASEAESQKASEAESQKASEAESQAASESESQKTSEAESQKASEAERQAKSEAESQTASEAESQKASEAESQAASEAESQKASESESQAASEAESQKASESESQAASESENQAASESESQAASEAESQKTSEAESQAASEAESQRASEVESQAASEAERQAASEAESQKASEAESQKASEAESQKTSESESQAESEAESQAASEAESQAASEAESQAASEAESQEASEAESQATSEAESQAASEAESQAASEAESQAASEAESQAASEAESQAASEAESQRASEAETVVEKTAPVAIDETHFPDAVWRAYVQERFDTDGDGILSKEEAEAVTAIGTVDAESLEYPDPYVLWTDYGVAGKGIHDLTGIAYFTNLEYLNCGVNNEQETQSRNELEKLDVSANTALKVLSCSENQLTELDLSYNTALIAIECSGNQLSELDVSANTALIILECSGNALSELDLSACSVLDTVICPGNQITALNLDSNPAINYLDCGSNQLTELDISNLLSLWYLDCGGNPITALDLSHNTDLYYFSSYGADGGFDFSIDLSANTALAYFDCNEGQSYTGVGDSVQISAQ